MSDQSRYCSHCGAANPVESQACFSCQHPFAEPAEQAQGILLNGRYQLLTQVGAGGFGGVYRAVDTAEGQRIVAVKEINLRGLSAQEIIEATDGFNREVRLLSTLRHPHLPAIHDTFTDAEHWYLVMDFIEGETLEAYLQRTPGGHLSLKDTLALGLQLCTVLNYLHSREPAVIFRDLKPGNVMRTFQGHIYLIDFGIARHFSPGKPKDTMPFGSPGYAAPEQYGRAQTTPRADIYSLGALLHQLLTGNDPAESPFRFAPLPMGDSPELAELDALIQRMVATAPGERPSNTFEVQGILQRLLDTLLDRDLQTLRPAPRVGTSRRRVLSGAFKIGGAVVGMIGGAVVVCELGLDAGHLYGFRGGIHGSAVYAPPSPGTVQQQLIYRGHKGPITALSWSPDGTMVASGGADGTVQVWRAADGVMLYKLSGYTSPVTSVSWASNRVNVIASAGNTDGTVQVWDALRDHRELIFHGDGRVLALDWQSKAPWIVSGGTDQDIYTWNATTGAKGASYRGHKGNVNALLWLPNPNLFSSFNASAIQAGQMIPDPLMGPGPLGTPTPPPTPPPLPTDTPAPTPQPTQAPTPPTVHANVIASGGADSTVQLWDAQTGKHILTYAEHQCGINGLAFVEEPYGASAYIASASDDGTVHVWTVDKVNGRAVSSIYRGHSGKVNAVTVLTPPLNTPLYYGRLVVSAGDDRTVQLWSERNIYETLMAYRGHNAPVKAVAASPMDNRVVSGDNAGLVHLWTVRIPLYQ